MKKQLLNTLTVVVLSGFMLLGLFSRKTFSFIQTEKKLAINNNNGEINEGSKESLKKARLIYPTKTPSIIHSFLPGPIYPAPDTTKTK